ncbi:MAG: glycosyltransferase family 10 [Verrucomicrobium sp.]|nr:glycosyltransferase family 10 [Verrucomicrobium sp.]
MIRVPAASLQTPYPTPFAELLVAGFGSHLEAECLCGLIRGHLNIVRDRGDGQPPSLFEIGTHRGAGICHFHAMAPELEIASLNVLPEHLANLPRQMPDEILAADAIGSLARERGVPYVQHLGNSRTFDWEVLAAAQRFDIVFIDGSHEQFTVMADTLHALQILKPDGLIIWHDYKVIDEPGRQVFAAVNDLDEHEFGGQIHHVQGTWLAYARSPASLRSEHNKAASLPAGHTAPTVDRGLSAADGALRFKEAPTWHETLPEAISWHLAHERKVSFVRRVQGLPTTPRVLFFSDHHHPVWPEDAQLAGPAGLYEITKDPTQLRQADIVVFHLPQVPSWARLPRHDRQIWVGVTMESDGYYPWQTDPSQVATLDLLISCHAFADVQMTYAHPGSLDETARPAAPKVPAKLVCAFISNSQSLSKRERLVERLEKLLPVHHFGKWHYNQSGERPEGRQEKLEVLRQYQFCLAFENNIQAHYVTEKWYDCFVAGCVPVYLGAPNIADFAPGPGSYLDVTHARSLTDLASTIKATASTTPHYQNYFQWKQNMAPSFQRLYQRPVDQLTLMGKIDHMIDEARQRIPLP